VFSISLRDGVFIAVSGLFGGAVLYLLISIFGGPALGTPTIQNIAFLLWIIGFFLIVTIAYLSTLWNKRFPISAKRGAQTGALTVVGSALIGTILFKIIMSEAWLSLLFSIFGASLLFIPLGAFFGAIIYRPR